MDVRVGIQKKLSTKELMLLKSGVREDSWESLGLQRDPTVHPKGNQSWEFTGRIDVEAKLQYFGHLMQRTDSFEKNLTLGKTDDDAEAPILWPSDVKSVLIRKDPDAGKDWRQKEEWLRIRCFDRNTDTMDMNLTKTLGGSRGLRSLACCSPWGCKKLDKT